VTLGDVVIGRLLMTGRLAHDLRSIRKAEPERSNRRSGPCHPAAASYFFGLRNLNTD
jgi:hypothetical protein